MNPKFGVFKSRDHQNLVLSSSRCSQWRSAPRMGRRGDHYFPSLEIDLDAFETATQAYLETL